MTDGPDHPPVPPPPLRRCESRTRRVLLKSSRALLRFYARISRTQHRVACIVAWIRDTLRRRHASLRRKPDNRADSSLRVHATAFPFAPSRSARVATSAISFERHARMSGLFPFLRKGKREAEGGERRHHPGHSSALATSVDTIAGRRARGPLRN